MQTASHEAANHPGTMPLGWTPALARTLARHRAETQEGGRVMAPQEKGKAVKAFERFITQRPNLGVAPELWTQERLQNERHRIARLRTRAMDALREFEDGPYRPEVLDLLLGVVCDGRLRWADGDLVYDPVQLFGLEYRGVAAEVLETYCRIVNSGSSIAADVPALERSAA